jgi:tryptophan synthase alpha chain
VLEAEIQRRKQGKEILLMTHIVLGYPSFDDSRRIAEAMVEAGVDMMELQIPFSEPMADGPVILHANQKALSAGATVDLCLEQAAKLAKDLPIPFVFMSYYNIAFARGLTRFAQETRQAGLRGAIVPDLPLEEGASYLAAMERESLDPIFIFAPSTTDARMAQIAHHARGFVYCVARKGVTGAKTEFAAVDAYLSRCRKATKLPLAVGFGVKNRADIEKLYGKADIAVVGSETIRCVDADGVGAVGPFIRSLVEPKR